MDSMGEDKQVASDALARTHTLCCYASSDGIACIGM
jgi:hypothetical protein